MSVQKYIAQPVILLAGREAGQQEASQMCNPPMVHALASHCAKHSLYSGLAAAARGDGVVAIYSMAEQGPFKGRKKNAKAAKQPQMPVFASRCHDAAVSCM